MLSTHPEPFSAFISDLQLPGCEVHLYKGPNAYGGTIFPDAPMPAWWDTENVYFLAGVRTDLRARAADADVLQRGMFTLDFDIRKELEKKGKDIWKDTVEECAERIISTLEPHPMWGRFRYIVMSGNGMHVHYFGEPVGVVKEEWSAGMKDICEEIAKITPIPPDFGCTNAGRIMRMPGSWNVKNPTEKKPVDIVIWMPGVSLPPMQLVQERGRVAIQRAGQRKEQEKQEFAASGKQESGLLALINSIPIEQVVQQLLGCRVKCTKADGGMRFVDDKNVERGFFKHHQYNIIVHEGTALFAAPVGVGYNCLGLARAVLGKTTHDTIEWFCERSAPLRDAKTAEKAAWVTSNTAEEVLLFEEFLSTIDHV